MVIASPAHPLQDLTRAATSLTAGNYRIRVPAGEAGPEVTTLAHAFNTMADRLEHTEQVRRQMLSNLAHEMGTPLSVLTVYLDGLQDGVVDWNNATHTIMADQLARLTRLMEDIDDVSLAQEHRIDLDLAEEGLGDLLHTAAAAAGEAYADKGVDLQVETITDTARVLVDRQRFGQVMSNLLSNALRHTPAGGQVRISVHRQGASTALIHVADDGEGIPPGQLGHIFERFYRGGGCCPQPGQRRGRYRSDHLQGIDRGPRRHSHRHLPRTRSRSGVCPPPPAVPSRQ